MTVHHTAVITCEHPHCPNTITGPPATPHSQWSEAGHIRLIAQAEGWATRRNHAGRDLCAIHRDTP